jgi:hypothetical protein
VVPTIDGCASHYVYPVHTVHVTVCNLDAATVDVEDGIACLRRMALPAPTLAIGGIGCSPDTLFLRCTFATAFAELRSAVRRAFGVTRSRPSSWFYSSVAFANVVRFNGPGVWPGPIEVGAVVTVVELEVVWTDRFLSDAGTQVLARIPLGSTTRPQDA